MENTTAMLIKRFLESLEGSSRPLRQPDLLDEDVFEVLAGVPWVREALAEFSPTLGLEEQREVLSGLKTMAA